MTPKLLHVLNVSDRRRIGSIELSDEGELRITPRGVQGLVDRMTKSYGWNPQEAFKRLNGWSNGYLQIVPALAIARVFDGLRSDTDEPYFADDHPVVGDLERRRLSAYLKAGRPVFSTTAREVDRMDPSRGRVVPQSFRTDGRWIWTDTVTYYLETYGLEPEAELVSHIAANDYECPGVDEATARRALDELGFSGPERARPSDGNAEMPRFSGSGDRPPPPIRLETADGALDVASNLSAEEYRILEGMRRELNDPPVDE